MLAQLFLNARKLGITHKEREALIDILGWFERGYFVHSDPDPAADDYAVGLAFNMSYFDCGTTACIAGWCDAVHGTKFVNRVRNGDARRPGRRRNLQDLFYGENYGRGGSLHLHDITPFQAAQALRNYLTAGKPHWGDSAGRT